MLYFWPLLATELTLIYIHKFCVFWGKEQRMLSLFLFFFNASSRTQTQKIVDGRNRFLWPIHQCSFLWIILCPQSQKICLLQNNQQLYFWRDAEIQLVIGDLFRSYETVSIPLESWWIGKSCDRMTDRGPWVKTFNSYITCAAPARPLWPT